MSDQQITCSDCGDMFVFTAAEQAFYSEKGLASPPKRCKACRQARKSSRGGAGPGASHGHGGHGHGGHGGGKRSYSNDVNEYRSPMSSGDRWGNNAHGQEWARGGGGGAGGGGNARRGGGGWGGPRAGGGFEARGGGQAPREGNHWNGQARGASSSDYRSPAFPESRGGGRDARPRRADGPRAGRGPSADARPAPRPPAQPRPERPKFDITCAECGTAAQVPFKPLEGRQVFCQECYRARRGTPREAIAATDVAETDTGIVE